MLKDELKRLEQVAKDVRAEFKRVGDETGYRADLEHKANSAEKRWLGAVEQAHLAAIQQHAKNHAPALLEELRAGARDTWERVFFDLALRETEEATGFLADTYRRDKLRAAYSLALTDEMRRLMSEGV